MDPLKTIPLSPIYTENDVPIRIVKWIIVTLISILLSACGPAQGTNLLHDSSVDPEDGIKTWKMVFFLTGGFAGMQVNVYASSTGEVVVADEKIKKQVKLQLTTADLERFTRLVKGLGQIRPPAAPPTCADCFQYELNVISGCQNFKMTVNDMNLDASGLKKIIDTLMKLQNIALSKYRK